MNQTETSLYKRPNFEELARHHHLHYAKEHILLLPKEKQKIFRKIGRKFGGVGILCELARMRDNYTCQICGKKWHPGMRKFDVHHLDRAIESKKAKDRTIEDYKGVGMITLCHKCHLNLEEIRDRMIRKIKL